MNGERNFLVGVFDDRDAAERARSALRADGVRDGQMGLAGATERDDENALSRFIERMFSGLLLPDDPHLPGYAGTLSRGGALLALHDLDDEAQARAALVMKAQGARDVRRHSPTGGYPSSPRPDVPAPDPLAERELEAVSTVGGPQVYVLPNAPVDWGLTSGPGRVDAITTDDPARPADEIEDTIGLDPVADREALEARREAASHDRPRPPPGQGEKTR
jgi:hypothetical protein